MKILETREGGFGGAGPQEQVRELAPGEDVPEGARQVPDDTPVRGWGPVEEVGAPGHPERAERTEAEPAPKKGKEG